MTDTRIPVGRLAKFVSQLFVAVDVSEQDASTTADRLIEADLRGRIGHGVIRVPLYIGKIQAGGIDPRPDTRILFETQVSAVIDGGNGLGHPTMTLATETAIAKANEIGMAWVGTRNSNHAGAGGVYTALALDRGMIGMYYAVANANVMPPWGGTERLLGTNPIAVAVPAGEQPAFQLDIATTVASHGTIKVAAQRGESMPEGWVQAPDGTPITDPAKADEGFLMPIGGYKGSGLNLMAGIFAGVLNGAAFGEDVIDHRRIHDRPTNTGQSIFVMRPDLFGPVDHFLEEMDRHLTVLRTSDSMTGQPLRLPGDTAAASEAEGRRDGVLVSEPVLASLDSLAENLGIDDRLD